MGENSIQAIGQADGDQRATIAMYQLFQNQLIKTSETVTPPVPANKSEKPAEKPPEKQAQSSLPITTGSDTFLKFMVDKKTNDITVYIVDRASHKVMRSIPPNEVNNLKAGDLLKLLV